MKRKAQRGSRRRAAPGKASVDPRADEAIADAPTPDGAEESARTGAQRLAQDNIERPDERTPGAIETALQSTPDDAPVDFVETAADDDDAQRMPPYLDEG